MRILLLLVIVFLAGLYLGGNIEQKELVEEENLRKIITPKKIVANISKYELQPLDSLLLDLRNGSNLSFCDQKWVEESGLKFGCIIEAARQSRNISFCRGLGLSLEVFCEAQVLGDETLCYSISERDLRRNCRDALSKNKGMNNISCDGRSGQERVWCIVWGAKSLGECAGIDERVFVDEHLMCIALVEENDSLCSQISDGIVSNLCLRSVLGLDGFSRI